MTKKNIIKCPVCGMEYLPAEIFYPKSFFGTPRNIIKDENGVILTYEGHEMDMNETYKCDKCNTDLSVDAIITFKVAENNDIFKDDDF